MIGRVTQLALSKKIDGIDLKELASKRTTRTQTLTAKRGNIYSKDGEVLAQNVSAYKLIAYLDPKRTTNNKKPQHVVDKEKTAEALAPILNMEECTKCGKIKNKEEHTVTKWEDNGDGTHSGACTVCEYKITESHDYNDDDKCSDCGTTKPEETCEHDWKEKGDNKYHWEECTKCGKIKNKEEHTITKWEDNGDGTHKGTCKKCNQTISRNHEKGSNDKCKECNASMNNNNNSNAEKPLPNTGKKTVIISIIGLTTIFGTSIVGIKKYKDIA